MSIEENEELTIEQKELLYLIAKITDSQNCPTTWVKETPLQAIIFYGIRKGLFNEYDYAPISSSFLGQGRKFVNISKGRQPEMKQSQNNCNNQKVQIAAQVAELSRLLGMIPSDGAIEIQEPLTQNKIALSDWFSATRNSFLKLSLLISKEMDIQMQ